jgi:hypothetical protein
MQGGGVPRSSPCFRIAEQFRRHFAQNRGNLQLRANHRGKGAPIAVDNWHWYLERIVHVPARFEFFSGRRGYHILETL